MIKFIKSLFTKDRKTFRRVLRVLRMYYYVVQLHDGNHQKATRWILKPSSLFFGMSPLALTLAGGVSPIAHVREILGVDTHLNPQY